MDDVAARWPEPNYLWDLIYDDERDLIYDDELDEWLLPDLPADPNDHLLPQPAPDLDLILTPAVEDNDQPRPFAREDRFGGFLTVRDPVSARFASPGRTHLRREWQMGLYRGWSRRLGGVQGAIPLMWAELSSNTHVPLVYDRSLQWRVQPLAPDALPNPVPGSDFAIAQACGFLAVPPTYLTADVTTGSVNDFRMVFKVSESLRAQRGVAGGLTATLVALVRAGRREGPLVRGALLRAVSDGDVGVVRAFLDSNGDVNTGYGMVEDDEGRPNLSGWSLLHG